MDTLIRERFGGLYLDQCNGYKVEENSFTSNTISPTAWSIGLIINNSNTYPYDEANNEIYNNVFDNIDIGILAQNRNRDETGDYGLSLKCNDFSNTRKYDIAVTTYDPTIMQMGIKNVQGVYSPVKTDPSGNTFSTFSAHGNYDYRYHNEGGSFVYNHHDPNATPPQFKVDLGPNGIYGSLNITSQFYLQNSYDKASCCPSRFINGGGGINEDKDALEIAGSQIDSTQNLLDLLVDGGNTDQLVNDITYSTPPEAVDTYNNLMEKSPYLSDTVLINAVQKEEVLSSAMITEVLTANPQASKSDEVLEAVENRIDQLSDQQMSEVMTGATVIGGKELLEAQMYSTVHDHSIALNNILRFYIIDTLGFSSQDSMVIYLQNSDYLWSNYQGVYLHTDLNDSVFLMNRLDSVAHKFEQGMINVAQHADITRLILLDHGLSTEGKSMLQADSLQRDMLVEIAQSTEGMVNNYARNLLTAITGSSNYQEPYQMPVPEVKSGNIRFVSFDPPRKDFLKIYPNPARRYAIAEYHLTGQRNNCVIRLLDYKGDVLQEQKTTAIHGFCKLKVSDCSPGLYMVSIACGDEILESVKLMIAE